MSESDKERSTDARTVADGIPTPTIQAETRAPRPDPRIPMHALTAGIVLTLALAMMGIWVSSHLYAGEERLVRTERRLDGLMREIIRLDEVLTSSARMYAMTGDPKWEERYRYYEPQAGRVIREAARIAPEARIGASAKSHGTTNVGIVDMEEHALDLVRAGRRDEAIALLFGEEYEAQKAIYADGMERSMLVVQERATSVLEGSRDRVAWTAALGLLASTIATICWLLIRRAIRRHLLEAKAAEDALEKANTELEVRVKHRTQQLLEANSILRNEMEERTRIEIDFRQAQKLESVGRLAAGVAHEINTPVQFVGDSIHFARDVVHDIIALIDKYQALRGSVAEGSAAPADAAAIEQFEDEVDYSYLAENLPKALERAIEGLERVATIVRSMKEFAHPDTKEKTSSDLNRSIRSTLTIARNEYKYVAELVTDLGDLPPVLCHVGELNQVVLNMVVNAAHAIEEKNRGTQEKGEIHVRTWADGDDVCIAIRDTGSGIPEHARDKIFDPFFTTKEVGKGTGQGLAIARSVVVDKHDGSIEFETQVGVGTTFTIRLPGGLAGEATSPDSSAHAEAEAA